MKTTNKTALAHVGSIAIVILGLVIIFVGLWMIFGESTFKNVFCIILFAAALVNLFVYLKTKNKGSLILMLFCFFDALVFLALSLHIRFLALAFTVPALIIWIYYIYFLYRKRKEPQT
jgi:hypothetical protein